MKFAIGYQQPENECFTDILNDYRDVISEVYFPWVGTASGRASLGNQRGNRDWGAQHELEEDLRAIKKEGIKLDLLFNANCYGARAVSEHLENETRSIIDYLDHLVDGVEIVTTTSLAIARTVKHYYPEIEVRASVNMRIGTIEAMRHVEGLFDSFYLQRDRQRDIAYAKEVKDWCDAQGKGLFILVNSGCLLNCPGQTFHDNMVAHDSEIDEMKNIPNWTPHVCWNRFRDQKNWAAFLQATWIRPEDLFNYDDLFPVVKLATRMHSHPRMVINAYAQRDLNGNLADLFEPSFSRAFAPRYIDNKRFPENWFERTSTCDRRCHKCGYCEGVLSKVLV